MKHRDIDIAYLNDPKDSFQTYIITKKMFEIAHEKLNLKNHKVKRIKEKKASVKISQGRKHWLLTKYCGEWLLLFRTIKRRKKTIKEQEEFEVIKRFNDIKEALLYIIINMDSEVYPN